METIAGWSLKYANAFPGVGDPPDGLPKAKEDWERISRGAASVLALKAVRNVISCSYDRVFVDEYQDCDSLHHDLVMALSITLPTVIFGDPMQGIFEFTGDSIRWTEHVAPNFPLAVELLVPRRWEGKDPTLGAWIAQTRGKLMRGEIIDLQSGPVNFIQAPNAFAMEAFFERFIEREGSIAAIHCRRGMCDKLASATRGAFQSIEEIAAKRLRQFAMEWDQAPTLGARLAALRSLHNDCFSQKPLSAGEIDSREDAQVIADLKSHGERYEKTAELSHVRSIFSLSRKHPRWRVFRGELWRDANRALSELAAGRASNLADAVSSICQRTSLSGRATQKRTISTPLLLKGLEFDHVLIPDATHFLKESNAQAKLFYVAISRATRSLTITAPDRYIQFPVPNL
ncbi:UvrD-helicase domain-containing protein [Massilia soli]|uniref:UvrD-helicase domain-containing protein n=1 Tax=Massilia soli TaxID=2792854 RepID=UPI003F893F32